MLPDHPHLRDAERLAQRQMCAYHAKGPPRARCIQNNGPPVAMTGQIQQDHIVDPDIRGQKQDHPQKTVTIRAPSHGLIGMGMAQAGLGLDPLDIQNAAMRALFFIGFLQDQQPGSGQGHLGQQDINGPCRINASVLPFATMDVPADAGEFGADGPGHRTLKTESMRRDVTHPEALYAKDAWRRWLGVTTRNQTQHQTPDQTPGHPGGCNLIASDAAFSWSKTQAPHQSAAVQRQPASGSADPLPESPQW
jgi:hypothetical protein